MPFDLKFTLYQSIIAMFDPYLFFLLLTICAYWYAKEKVWSPCHPFHRFLFHFSRVGAIAILVVVSLSSILITPLIHQLESTYPAYQEPQTLLSTGQSKNIPTTTQYIVVLGSVSSSNGDNRFSTSEQLSSPALRRLLTGIALVKNQSNRILILTGTGATREPVASVMSRMALELGIPSSKIIALTSPRTTHEEAQAVRKQLKANASIILTTSALHLPRAMFLFRKAGLKPIAAPTDYLAKYSSSSWRSYVPVPSLSGWESLYRLGYELIALVKDAGILYTVGILVHNSRE